MCNTEQFIIKCNPTTDFSKVWNEYYLWCAKGFKSARGRKELLKMFQSYICSQINPNINQIEEIRYYYKARTFQHIFNVPRNILYSFRA